jgi:hypothetical protein
VGAGAVPADRSDKEHGEYCNQMDLDFLTGDNTAYMSFFDAGIRKLKISIFGRDENGNKPVYLLRIVK